MENRWQIRINPNPELVNQINDEFKTGELLATLMAQRGLDTAEKASKYFNPSLDQLLDPMLMLGLDKAVERIITALEKDEKILIYGDYDVDGTTAVSLVYQYFKEFYSEIEYYIPDRTKEGYGISTLGIDFAKTHHFNLIIALDCGIKAVDKIQYANELGIDFIICDHHTPGDELPEAVAILNPKQNGCPYPYKELSGCGIGFKLITALYDNIGIGPNPLEFIDLVALSIASDIVPITGENRILTHFGLEKINSNPGVGMTALKKVAGFKGPYSVTDVVFKLGPRINAVGRMSHGSQAVRLLAGNEDEETIEALAIAVDEFNQDRKSLDRQISEECLEILSNEPKDKYSTVLAATHWHKGVIGIVASRIIEVYYRPTIILTESDSGDWVGSARSVEGFDIYAAIDACRDLLLQFGGHRAAAGLTLSKSNLDAFKLQFEVVVAKQIQDWQKTPTVYYDAEIQQNKINWKLFNTLNRFGPFGPENMRPTFICRNVKVLKAKLLSADHLKFTLFNGIEHLECLGFNLGSRFTDLNEADSIDICFSIEFNEWQGNKFLQLQLKDFKTSKQ